MKEEENNKEKRPFKVVLIGDSGIGKTCIMAQFINNKFDPNTIANICAQFIQKILEFPDGKKITFHFWDTAGQEQYHSLAKIFYKDADVVILVYDITNLQSFNSMKDNWYKNVVDNGKKDVLFGVAANKSDLYEERQVDDDEGEKFAKSIGGIFMPTSAKNYTGITELFDAIGQKILNKDDFDFFTKEKKETIKNLKESKNESKSGCC
jgi:small GTP-binding protein